MLQALHKELTMLKASSPRMPAALPGVDSESNSTASLPSGSDANGEPPRQGYVRL